MAAPRIVLTEGGSGMRCTAIAAELQHAQPGGAAAGKELLAATVARMAEVLGDNHQNTRKYQQVLQEIAK